MAPVTEALKRRATRIRAASAGLLTGRTFGDGAAGTARGWLRP